MTTGQPIKVPSDRNKFDNEFMDNLKLQIKLNDQNLQANRLYINTGQLPASTQMADTRSTTEKLADIEGLKSSIAGDLRPLAEPAFAYNIINSVMQSPLNVDNTLLRFLAQNAPQLAQQLSKKYKFGIRGDANDCEIIVNFISDAYNTLKGSMQSIKGYINTTNQSTNAKNSILTSNDMDKIQSDLTDFIKRLRIMKINQNQEQVIIPRVNNLIQVMNTLKSFLPNNSQLQDIISIVQQQDVLETPQNAGQYQNQQLVEYNQQKDLKEVFLILSDLPVHKTVQTLLSILYESVKNANLTTFNQTITNLDGLFAPFTRQPNLGILQNFRNYYLQRANHMEQLKSEQSIHKIQEMQQDNIRASKAQRVYVINPEDDPVFTTDGIRNVGPMPPPVNNAGQFANLQNLQNPNLVQAQQQQAQYQAQQAQQAQQDAQDAANAAQQQAQQQMQQQDANVRDALLGDIAGYLAAGIIGGVVYAEFRHAILQGEIKTEQELQMRMSQIPTPPPPSLPKFEEISNGSRNDRDLGFSPYNTGFSDYQDYQSLGFDPYEDISQGEIYETSKNENRFDPSVKLYPEPKGWETVSDRMINNPKDSLVNNFLSQYAPDGGIPERSYERDGETYFTTVETGRKGNLYKNEVPARIYFQHNPHIPVEAIRHMLGHGLIKKIKKGRGLRSDYRDFGINKINHKKLEDGILTLRRGTNSNYPDMPSKRISRKLQKIITHISGGGVPDFNEINNLENGEKDYLHKLISKSNLQERLSVPTPSKDQEEKDFHQFEVMKGEIMSGNDSKELIKKFKILILKLSKQNVLPKNEVQELLQDLLHLGY